MFEAAGVRRWQYPNSGGTLPSFLDNLQFFSGGEAAVPAEVSFYRSFQAVVDKAAQPISPVKSSVLVHFFSTGSVCITFLPLSKYWSCLLLLVFLF